MGQLGSIFQRGGWLGTKSEKTALLSVKVKEIRIIDTTKLKITGFKLNECSALKQIKFFGM